MLMKNCENNNVTFINISYIFKRTSLTVKLCSQAILLYLSVKKIFNVKYLEYIESILSTGS